MTHFCAGILLAVAGGESAVHPTLGRALVLRRSTDGGETWGNISFPFGPFADAHTVCMCDLCFVCVGSVSGFCVGSVSGFVTFCARVWVGECE